MGKIADEIFEAIEVMIDKKINSLSFANTIEGKIIKKTNIGYLVSVEGNNIDIPVLGNGIFQVNEIVKVHIPQNNIKNAYIIGTGVNNEKQVNELKYNLTQIQEYSHTEKLIGKWNGKNLYRQTITIDTPTSIAATSWSTLKTIMPSLNVVSIYGTWEDANCIYPFCYGSYHINYVKTSGIVRFYNPNSSAITMSGFKVIIEYTR